MEVRVKAPDAASAESLRRQLDGIGDATSVVHDESRDESALQTHFDDPKALAGALNTIEHWLETDGIGSTEIVVGKSAHIVFSRESRSIATKQPGHDDGTVRPFRVLVVDDDPGIRMLCAAGLAEADVEVLEAEDGRCGLERALAERPDLVLLDVNMPILDGFALAERLRGDARTRHLPLVFLTGEVGSESRAKAYALGAAGFVTKPFDSSALISLILGLLRLPPREPLTV